MSLSISTFLVAFLVGIGLLAAGIKAYKQNLPLLQALRTGNRDIKSMFWHAFVVWCPMTVVIVVLLGVAQILTWGMTELAYRYTTLDEFCEVQQPGSPIYVACTGMGNELATDQIKQVPPGEDLERQIFRRYGESRKRLLRTPLAELREQAKNPAAFRKIFSPAAVLGLPPGIEDDPTLSQLSTERRRLVQSPIPTPTDIVEVLSYRQSVDTRNRILREIDVKIEAQRNVLYASEYRGLTPEQILQHVQRNRVLTWLGKVQVTIDPATLASLMAPANEVHGTAEEIVRAGLVRSLAHSERDTWKLLSRQTNTAADAAGIYDVLGMEPQCTVAAENTEVRSDSGDFNLKSVNADESDEGIFSQDNAGTFSCVSKVGATKRLKLVSVGFRKSVLFSIDRFRDEAAFQAFKKLAILERNADLGATDAKTAARETANIVPAVIPLGRQDCGLFRPVNCVMNAIAHSAEAAYTRSRNTLMARITEQANRKVDNSALSIQQKIDHARVNADADIARMHSAGYETAESLFHFNDVLRAMGWIALLLIALRSFLYVLALEIFDKGSELKISFDVDNPVQGTVVAGAEVTIDRGFPFPVINRGSLTNTLADIKFAPWKWSAPIARILHGCYFLFNWSVFSPPNQPGRAEHVKGMEASARSGFSIVEWRMQPGEEVIFNYKDFYGASANVQLKTDVSFRLSTLLLGRVFFHYARCVEGEGRLLLEARIHNTTQTGISSFKPTRLVAWNRHAQFTADSHHQPWKTLINPYTIVRESTSGLAKGLVIIAPESESPFFFGMGIRSIRRIFSRIF